MEEDRRRELEQALSDACAARYRDVVQCNDALTVRGAVSIAVEHSHQSMNLTLDKQFPALAGPSLPASIPGPSLPAPIPMMPMNPLMGLPLGYHSTLLEYGRYQQMQMLLQMQQAQHAALAGSMMPRHSPHDGLLKISEISAEPSTSGTEADSGVLDLSSRSQSRRSFSESYGESYACGSPKAVKHSPREVLSMSVDGSGRVSPVSTPGRRGARGKISPTQTSIMKGGKGRVSPVQTSTPRGGGGGRGQGRGRPRSQGVPVHFTTPQRGSPAPADAEMNAQTDAQTDGQMDWQPRIASPQSYTHQIQQVTGRPLDRDGQAPTSEQDGRLKLLYDVAMNNDAYKQQLQHLLMSRAGGSRAGCSRDGHALPAQGLQGLELEHAGGGAVFPFPQTLPPGHPLASMNVSPSALMPALLPPPGE